MGGINPPYRRKVVLIEVITTLTNKALEQAFKESPSVVCEIEQIHVNDMTKVIVKPNPRR